MKLLNFIDGVCLDSTDKYFKRNPVTEEIIAEVSQASKDQVGDAVKSARKSLSMWKSKSRIERSSYFYALSRIIEDDKDYISRVISEETGKSLNESMAEVIESLHSVQLAAGMGFMQAGELFSSEIPDKDIIVFRKPKGVVAVISAWNFPFALFCWKIPAALVEGNTVVFKPSEDSPKTGDLLMRLFRRANFPDGVINLIHGNGVVGKYLVEDNIDHVLFTGSEAVGANIKLACAKSDHMTCSCEMGGKNAQIVFADGDYDLALKAALLGSFKLSGQRCVSTSRILVERTIFEKFCQDFKKLVEEDTVVGNPETKTEKLLIGPLINQSQLDRIICFNNLTSTGSTILVQGKKVGETGYFISPHVYSCEWNNTKPYLTSEVFGPHVAIIPFDNLEDAVRIHNDTIYGLSVSIITSDLFKIKYLRENIEAGMFYFNLPGIGAESQNFFGGVKQSGYGWSSARGTYDAVVHKIAVTINYSKEIKMAQGLKK